LKGIVAIDIVLSSQVKEHLEMFGILKGVEEDALENAVTKMIDEVSFYA